MRESHFNQLEFLKQKQYGIMNNKCPCVECICKPICEGKSFSDLMGSCKLVSKYYYMGETENHYNRLKIIMINLKPSWENIVNLKTDKDNNYQMSPNK
jgi:hypothetical protein